MQITKQRSKIRVVIPLTFVAAFFTMATNAVAKENPPQELTVIAHLPLPGTAVQKMSLQQQGGRQYLYIQQGAQQQGITVIDVTRPNKPAITKRDAFPNTAAKGKLQVFQDGFAIAETPETQAEEAPTGQRSFANPQPAASVAHPRSVRILDLSDPANPRTLKTFDGVTSVVPDEGRNLIYLTDTDGLWILRHRRRAPRQICDSESAFLPIVNCYAY